MNMNANATWATPTYEPTLREKLKHVLSHHTAQEVHETLMDIFQEDFTYLKKVFGERPAQSEQVTPSPKGAPQPPPQVQPTQVQQPPVTKMRGDIRIRVVKRAEDTAPAATDIIEEAIEIQPQPLNVDTLPDVPSTTPEEPQAPVSEKERKARIKKEQAAAEQKKFQELIANGIKPESLLTKENLNTWVNAQGLSFTQIARDHVGIDAEKISDIAKSFGIQSNISKKRAQIFAAKRR